MAESLDFKRKHRKCSIYISSFPLLQPIPSPNSTRELHIFRHDGHPFRVDGAQIGILKQANQVSFRSFLERGNGRTLPTVRIMGKLRLNLPYQTSKGQPA